MHEKLAFKCIVIWQYTHLIYPKHKEGKKNERRKRKMNNNFKLLLMGRHVMLKKKTLKKFKWNEAQFSLSHSRRLFYFFFFPRLLSSLPTFVVMIVYTQLCFKISYKEIVRVATNTLIIHAHTTHMHISQIGHSLAK